MTQAPSTTGSNANLTSTPIRIGPGGGGSGSATPIPHQYQQQHSIGTGNESSSPGPAVGAPATPQQSSSVPNNSWQLQNMGSSMGGSGSGTAGAMASSGTSLTPPNSAGLRQSGGISSWATEKYDGNLTDKTPNDASKLNRKESYKAQRKNYRREKKRVASELLNSIQDPAVIVLADWLKVRGTLKSWTKLWCVLKPGLLLIYKSPKTKSSHWVGTVLLTSCQVIERPSKKDGFCFKLFHPMEQSIWAPRGPDKETIGAVVQPLPTAYLIFRAPSQAAGKCWMDALELSLRCSALLLRSNSAATGSSATTQASGVNLSDNVQISHETQWSEADYEKHFNDQDLDADSQNEAATGQMTESDTESDDDLQTTKDFVETPYVPVEEEFFGDTGEQVEELADENKSLIWILVKQVRPGMDLSKVVLPTFILEPRSFLDKLSDSYYHADILSQAVLEDDPFTRMKLVVKWYLSGFYKKPKGLKKPYNPILGETFRCFWQHSNGSRTYYIAEQVSHHPPISAFYVTNRQDGFSISCSILAKSKFYGNSTSAVLEGVATLTLLPRGESYTLTTPYAHCKGILMGTLSMELGGKINIDCENTGYKTELEFKLKPFLGGTDSTNVLSGKIKMGKDAMATISGHWDSKISIKDVKSSEETPLFVANAETKSSRLVRHVVPLDAQDPTESEKLWQHVTAAILVDDQAGATREKTVLEEMQRNSAKERKATFSEWLPKYFQQDLLTGEWIYKYSDMRPWDLRNDVKQYEVDYKVLTKTRIQAPMVRNASIAPTTDPLLRLETRKTQTAHRKIKSVIKLVTDVNASETSDTDDFMKKPISNKALRKLALAIDQVNASLEEHSQQLVLIHTKLERMHYAPSNSSTSGYSGSQSSAASSFLGIIPQSLPASLVLKSAFYAMIGIILVAILKILWK